MLKPGGYQRIKQIAEKLDKMGVQPFTGVQVEALRGLAESAVSDRHHVKPAKPAKSRKSRERVPLLNCHTAPCEDACPIHQEITSYVALAGEGKYDEALSVILNRNALPFITGTIYLALSDWNESVSRELNDVVRGGIRSFKLYMTYDAMVMDDKSIYEVLVRLKELGGIAGVHCENRGIIDAELAQVLRKKGHRRDVSDYPGTRPNLAEAEAVSRLLKIAACAGAPVIIVHLSTKEGLREVEQARAAGQTVYVETCPQYLLLDESRYRLPEARLYMCAPPLRTEADQEALWDAVCAGQIQTLATDHCSFTAGQKEAGAEDFSRTPCGMPGAQERPLLLWHYGVGTGRITAEQMCALLSENPARLYRLYPKKGVIAPGSDADLVIWDERASYTLSQDLRQSAAGYSPFEGTRMAGRPSAVWLRGRLVAADGALTAENTGRYVTAADTEILLQHGH